MRLRGHTCGGLQRHWRCTRGRWWSCRPPPLTAAKRRLCPGCTTAWPPGRRCCPRCTGCCGMPCTALPPRRQICRKVQALARARGRGWRRRCGVARLGAGRRSCSPAWPAWHGTPTRRCAASWPLGAPPPPPHSPLPPPHHLGFSSAHPKSACYTCNPPCLAWPPVPGSGSCTNCCVSF